MGVRRIVQTAEFRWDRIQPANLRFPVCVCRTCRDGAEREGQSGEKGVSYGHAMYSRGVRLRNVCELKQSLGKVRSSVQVVRTCRASENICFRK